MKVGAGAGMSSSATAHEGAIAGTSEGRLQKCELGYDVDTSTCTSMGTTSNASASVVESVGGSLGGRVNGIRERL